jgi:hypothetical protein
VERHDDAGPSQRGKGIINNELYPDRSKLSGRRIVNEAKTALAGVASERDVSATMILALALTEVKAWRPDRLAFSRPRAGRRFM